MNLKRGFNRLALVLAFLAMLPAAWAGWSLSEEVLTRQVNRLEGVRPELKEMIWEEQERRGTPSYLDYVLRRGEKKEKKEERAGRVEEFSRSFPDLTDQERRLLEEFQETGAVEAVRVVPPPVWQRSEVETPVSSQPRRPSARLAEIHRRGFGGGDRLFRGLADPGRPDQGGALAGGRIQGLGAGSGPGPGAGRKGGPF